MNTVVSIASLASAAAVPSPSIAAQAAPDQELRHLLATYLAALEQVDRAEEKHQPIRNAYDDEFDRWREQEKREISSGEMSNLLWEKHNLKETWEPLCEAYRKTRQIIEEIRAVPAETMFGVTVKLLALPKNGLAATEPEDLWQAIEAAIKDVDRITGAKFAKMLPRWRHWIDDSDRAEGGEQEVEENRKKPNPDPVWKALLAHQKTVKSMDEISAEHNRAQVAGLTGPARRNIERRYHRALDREEAALRNLFNTKPTSALGACIMMQYCEDRIEATQADELLGRECLLTMMRNVRNVLEPAYVKSYCDQIAARCAAEA